LGGGHKIQKSLGVQMSAQVSWIGRAQRGESIENPVLTPSGFEAKLGNADPDDTIPPINQKLAPPKGQDRDGRSFIIEYRDSTNKVSERRVTVSYIYKSGVYGYVMALCHERKAMRTFRLDRVVGLYSAITGEALQPIRVHLRPLWSRAPVAEGSAGSERSLTINMKPLRAAMRVLMTLARCDGHTHSLEVKVVKDFINEIAPRFNLGDSEILELAAYARYLGPNLTDFEKDLRQAFSLKGYSAFALVQYARLLIVADKKLANEEFLMIGDLMAIARSCGAVKPGDSLVELTLD
jgi:uncharacterized tellurite resistance protein B-like protein